jgi:hypothetical protein
MGGGPIGLFKVIRFCKNRREVNDEREVADAGSLRDAGGGGGAGGGLAGDGAAGHSDICLSTPALGLSHFSMY